MCGRYTYWDSTTIHAQYNIPANIEIHAHYNATPLTFIPVIISQLITDIEHQPMHIRALEIMQWGLIPEWAKPENMKGFFNARQETIAQKPSFKTNFKLRRCIIPARGFYEWDAGKQPYYITTPDEHMAFAGIWDGGNSGIFPTVAIITTQANILHTIHNRIPVVLHSRAHIDRWLNPLSKEQELLQMLADADDTLFQWYPVSKRVNNTKYNDKYLLQKIEEEAPLPLSPS